MTGAAHRIDAAPASARAHRALEAGAIAACAVLAVRVGWPLAAALAAPGAWPWLGAGLALGLLASDLASGLVHWWADRVASLATPWLGEHVVRPFREHHADPDAIVAHGLVETNGNNCLIALPVLAATAVWLPDAPGGALLLAGAALWSVAVSAGLTNQVHQWAHAPEPPRAVRALQRVGILLAPHRHARHHAPPFDRRYCITTGWLGPALDASGALQRLERLHARRRPRAGAALRPRSAAPGSRASAGPG